MKSWEKNRDAGLAEARATLVQLQGADKVYASFTDWWRDQDQAEENASQAPYLHPSTQRLADQLRSAGMDAVAEFSKSQWVKEGPIDSGVWAFSILLGRSFVTVFVEALAAGVWRSPKFFGLDDFGAWEAFDGLLRDRLRTELDVTAAAMQRLRLLVERVKVDPGECLRFHDRHRGAMEDRIAQYSASPDVDEAWKHPSDPHIWFEDSFLWDVLVEAEPADTLALLGSMPHPVFMRNCFQSNRLTGRHEEVANLIKAAPEAFNNDQAFQAGGAVSILLLEIAGAAIGRTALESDGAIHVVPLGQSELLAPTIERCQAATKTILDAVFSRHDAVPLAWAWLERMISNGKLRGRWPASGRGLAINLPILSIIAIAERLSMRRDWKGWIGKREKHWKIHRLMAVIAVGTFGRTPDDAQASEVSRASDALAWALTEGGVNYTGIGDAITDCLDVVAALGGHALCSFDDPAGWLAETWERLRPTREQNWRVIASGGTQNNAAELLTLWGFAAHELVPAVAKRKALWTSLEKSVRDSWQTDALGYAPVWSKALVRLFSSFEADKGECVPVERQLGQALFPYISADHDFLTLVISLTERGWPIALIRDAVATVGFDLKTLARQFLEMKELVFQLPRTNRDEIERFRKLANEL